MSDQPDVTVLLPMRNEEDFIARCLDSILANDYPADRIEILVLDGMSTDTSGQIVLSYAQEHPNIRLVENPNRIQSTALNLGLKRASGEIIIRMDAHATYATDYIRQCVTKLTTTDADNVGGLQTAVGSNTTSRAIALGMNSRFGFGNSPFHYSDTERWVDTVYLGAWHRSTLERLGGFDETAAVNEDYELNSRLRASGGKILLSPEIRSSYFVRPTLRSLVRQLFRYGFWKVRTLTLHPGSAKIRQLIPPAFILALCLSAMLAVLSPALGAIVPVVYLVINLSWSLSLCIRNGIRYVPLLPIVFLTMHLSWGAGFLVGLTKWGLPRLRLRHIASSEILQGIGGRSNNTKSMR